MIIEHNTPQTQTYSRKTPTSKDHGDVGVQSHPKKIKIITKAQTHTPTTTGSEGVTMEALNKEKTDILKEKEPVLSTVVVRFKDKALGSSKGKQVVASTQASKGQEHGVFTQVEKEKQLSTSSQTVKQKGKEVVREEDTEQDDDDETGPEMYTINSNTTLQWDLLEDTVARLKVF